MNVTATWQHAPVLAANGVHTTATVGALWCDDRPFSVRLLIGNGGRLHAPICWSFDRETLTKGLDHPVGADRGDYLVLPHLPDPDGHSIELILAPYQWGVGRSAAIVLPVADVRGFLDDTFAVVPLGAEVDHYLDELTGGAA